MPVINRVRDVLGALSPTYPTEGMINPPQEGYDVSRRMSELYNPERQDSDAFNALLGSYPERNQPSLLRKIGSSLTALGPGGYEAGRKALHQPFYDKLEDWKNRIGPTYQAATNERMENANLRSVANQIISQERMHERDLTAARLGEERIRQGDVRLTQSEQRVKQAEERLKIAQAVAKGGVFQMDKLSGTGRIVYKDGTSVPVDVNQLSQEDLLALQQENALERIRTSGEEARATRITPSAATARDRLRTEIIDDPDNPGQKILVTINLDTNEVKRATLGKGIEKRTVTPVTRTPETESNKAAGILNKAKQAKASNPQWNKWITIRGNNFDITRPGRKVFGTQLSGPTQAEYDQMYNAIYKSNRATDVITNEERVNVINPAGKRVSIKKSQLAEALKSGYKNAP